MIARRLALASGPLLVALMASCRGDANRDSANVLLITLDTTRADYLRVYGRETVETPTLDRLAAEGAWFTDAVTSIPLTLPAHTSLMTGRWPFEHGVRDNAGFFIDPEEETLAERLRDVGFSTFAVLGSLVLHHSWGLDQGFETYDDSFGDDPGQSLYLANPQRRAAEVVDRAIAWWERHPGERFFGWVHFYDPHRPYAPPEEFAALYPDDPYAGEVAYVDSQIARLVEYLEHHGLYENTLIAVIGDHGEGLDEHGEPDHGVFLYGSTLRVPWILRLPGEAPRGAIRTLARDVDFMPTVLDWLRLPPAPRARGRSLIGGGDGGDGDDAVAAYAETWYSRLHYGWSDLASLRDDRFKYIRAPRPELYDLASDVGETINVLDRHPEVARDLAAQLERLLAEAGDALPDPAQLDPDVEARLRALGYVGSSIRVAGEDLPDPKDRTASLELFMRVVHQVPEDLRARRYDEAASKLHEILAVEPSYLDGRRLLARTHLGRKQWDAAIREAERGLELSPDNLDLLHAILEAHIGKGEHGVALDLVQRIHALAPGYMGAYFTMANAMVELGQLDRAVAELRALLDVDSQNGLAHYEIGRIELRRGALDAAELAIRRGLELQPRLFGAHFNLALVAEQRGDLDAAQREYTAELEWFPHNHEAWTNLGLLYVQRGQLDAAVVPFRRVIELEPELYLGYYLLARLRMTQGHRDPETFALARRAAELEAANGKSAALLQALQSERGPG